MSKLNFSLTNYLMMIKKDKYKISFLLHIAPPIHGSSLVGRTIWKSNIINTNFDCQYINLLASQKLNNSGKFDIRKLVHYSLTCLRLIGILIKNEPQLVYFALSTTGIAFFKDVFLIILLKIFNVRIVFHLHNKGVSLKQNNFIYRRFYQFVFKDADVILLSKLLYPDIQQFVSEKKVHICPNGI